jgi:hypothetical protein
MASTRSSEIGVPAPHPHLRLVDCASSGIREEVVSVLRAPSRTTLDATLWGGALLMSALLENEGYSLWRISAVWVAALQRLADDQARFLFNSLSVEPEQAATSVSENILSAIDVLLQSQTEAASAAASALRDRNETLCNLAEFAHNMVGKIGLPDC